MVIQHRGEINPANIKPQVILQELQNQGFNVTQRKSGHYWVKPKDMTVQPFVIAVFHKSGRTDRFTQADINKLLKSGFIWPPPGREKEFGEPEPELTVLSSPNGDLVKPARGVTMTEEEMDALTPEKIMASASEFRLMDLDLLRFDTYQREVKHDNPSVVNEFNLLKAGCIYVSEREDGHTGLKSYYGIDGQHRTAGALKADIHQLPALIYKGLTRAEEAGLFYVLNNDRKPVSSGMLFKARLEAKDPVALDIQRKVTQFNYKIGFTATATPGYIMSVRALEYLYRWNMLTNTLIVISKVWPDERDALREDVMLGVGSVFKAFEPNVEREHMIARLSRVPLAKILRDAKTTHYELGGGMWQHIARVVLKEYNKNRVNRLTPFHPPTLPKARMDEPKAAVEK